jgi:peptide deformylase
MSEILPHPEIVTGKNAKALRSKAKRVEIIDAGITELVKKMRKIMKEAEGIGLAAPQIGIPLQVFVAEVNKKFYALINPEIIKASDELDKIEEGCLSLPGIYGPVERPAKITIAATDISGRKIKIKAWGLLARVFQHEMDHLNGMMIIDKAKDLRDYKNRTTPLHFNIR